MSPVPANSPSIEFTKIFSFSASHSSGRRIFGRNYKLEITIEPLDEVGEREFIEIVDHEIISKVHTHDLGEDVDFLKNIKLDDISLLKAFWKRLSVSLSAFGVKRLTLRRDSETFTTFWPEASA